MKAQTMTEREEQIEDLRELAYFLETHPLVPIPVISTLNAFVGTKEELALIARQSTWEKNYAYSYFELRRSFANNAVVLVINIDRNEMCQRVQTGTRVEPAKPAEPEREVPVYEWVCADARLLEDRE